MFDLYNIKLRQILSIEELHITKGKVTCIVGESGSGKTTLIKLLNMMITPDKGEILYNKNSIYAINPIVLRREIVMLSQAPAIYPGTIKDNLLIGLKFSEKPLVDDNALIETLKFINLNKRLSDNGDQLSGGEKQRLALGRVILMTPEVFLLDEPSSALDEETEELIIRKLSGYARSEGKTLIMVTHSKKIAMTFADKIIELKNGKVINTLGV